MLSGYEATKKRLLKLIPEIMEVVELAININNELPSATSKPASVLPQSSHQEAL